MSVTIPNFDTQQKDLYNSSELWNIIDQQRSVIQELQKALYEVTTERDQLLVKYKTSCSSSSSSSSSFTEDIQQSNTPTSVKVDLKSPTPPPRSPYRSNSNKETTTQKNLPFHKNQDTILDRPLPKLDKLHLKEKVNEDYADSDQLYSIQVTVKSIYAASLVISIINKKDGKELWNIEKSYTDLLRMDTALQNQNKLEHLLSDTVRMEQRFFLIQEYISDISRTPKDDTAFASLCSMICKTKIQKAGFLTKRGKYNGESSKRYYFSMSGSTLNYFTQNQNQLLVGMIPFTTETRIGKQTTIRQQDDSFQHAFILLLESTKSLSYRHILCAESDKERDNWVKELHSHHIPGKKPSLPIIRTKSVVNKKSSNSTLESQKGHCAQFNSDASTNIPEKTKPPLVLPPTKIRQKTYQRSSLDDQAIQKFYEENIASNQQKHQSHYLSTKASADSLPSNFDSTEKKKKKNTENRKSFWARSNKLFSNAVDTAVSSSFVSNKEPTNISYNNKKDSNSTSSVSTTNTVKVQVFGVPLDEAIRVSKISDNFKLPAIVYRCIEYLEAKKAADEEGIYRLSGSSTQITNLRQQFCEHGDVNILSLNDYHIDVHVVAGLLKMWLRELPVNVLTNELLNDFLEVIDIKDKKLRIKKLGQLVSILPIANYSLLRTLIAHLIHIVHNAEQNKMTLRNIGIVFAPTLSIPPGVFTLLMSEFDYIFWTSNLKKSQSRSIIPTPLATAQPSVEVNPTRTTSADRFKQQYLEAEERSNRNSLIYKSNVPMSLVSLEDINKDVNYRKKLCFDQGDTVEGNAHDGTLPRR